ncbi:MAG: pilus assembly protein TadG-related protein, partial [Actinomycetota bacterium]
MPGADRERGSTSVLVLGLALVVFAISGLAVDGTRAFIFRRTLQNSADGAVLAAASEIDTDVYYATGGRSTRLSGAASGTASEYLAARGLDVDAQLDVARAQVTLHLTGSLRTTFLG